MHWLEICATDILSKYKVLSRAIPYNKKLLGEALAGLFEGIAELLGRSWEEGGKVKGFKKGVIPCQVILSPTSRSTGQYHPDIKTVRRENTGDRKMGLMGVGKMILPPWPPPPFFSTSRSGTAVPIALKD
jgi:hypothetical protein